MAAITPAQIDIIKATVPILETGGETLTKHFYNMMLSEYPEVRGLFNQTNQARGTQPRALANSVLCYARNIDTLQNLGPLASQIVNKHVALQILPEHYPIVGNCLLRSIREVLGAEIATDAVIDAWGAAYQQLANILIEAEGKTYDALEAAVGGWRHARQFKVAKKEAESVEITSFYLEPVDGKAVIVAKAGQYLGLKVVVNGSEQRRNYSISQACDGKSLRISVKRIEGGVVSMYLHDTVKVGDELCVFPPAGDFTLSETSKPVVLVSGGVGITPTLPMLSAAVASKRAVEFVHYARDAKVCAFKQTIAEFTTKHSTVKAHTVFTREGGVRPTVDSMTAQFKSILSSFDVEAYVLGPKEFMITTIKALKAAGVPKDQIKYEYFGPHEQMDA